MDGPLTHYLVTEVSSFNPYWQRRGRTFADLDGYRVVLQQAAWGAQ